jgi:hypothetical protein
LFSTALTATVSTGAEDRIGLSALNGGKEFFPRLEPLSGERFALGAGNGAGTKTDGKGTTETLADELSV